jgi:chromosome segregation protein
LYLSKLEILGFKSFPYKTELFFDEGITVVVGPNGCGKTNILDAIRWVLGEQRTSLLRGERMEEVIFNGTKELKPLGMAEVSLVIQNNLGILPTEYQEVYITRRLFRSGESEYLLNKKICRLKDIIDLFLDTGMGAHAYSVIQPEMVESILSSKTEDRRFLFEEASGISKYKHRKKEALRKLESTENDLLRLKDLVTEVEKQVNSLKRQVRKSERFKRLSSELKDLELKLGKNQYELLREREEELEVRLSELGQERVTQQAKLAELELKNENLKLELSRAEKKFFSCKQELDNCLEVLHNLEKESIRLNERKLNLEEDKERLTKEIEENLSRRDLIAEEIEDKAEKVKEVLEKIRSKEKEHQETEEELKVKEDRLREFKEKITLSDARLSDAGEMVHQAELEEQNLKMQLDELERNSRLVSKEEENLLKDLEKIEREKEVLQNSILSCNNCLENKAEEKVTLQKRSEETRVSLESLTEKRIGKEKEVSSLKAKFELFRDMIQHYEGYQTGVRAVLGQKEIFPGLTAPVANLITAEKEYLAAIESALGESAQYILSEDLNSAQRGIEFLRKEKKGRATFIVLDRFKDLKFIPEKVELEGNGIKGWIRDFVKCEERYRPVIDFLLGKVILTDSLENGIELSSKLGRGYGVVTPDGQIIRDGRIMEGGSEKEIFLIGREEEVQKLSEKISSLDKQLYELNTKIEIEEKRKSEMQSSLLDLDKKIEEERIKLSELEVSIARQEENRKGLVQRQQILNQKKRELNQSIELLKDKEGVLNSGELQEKKKILEQECKNLSEELEKAEKERDFVYSNLNELRIELISLQGKEEQLRNEMERLKELETDLKESKESKQKELESLISKVEELDYNITGHKAILEEKGKEKEEKENQEDSCKQELEQIQPQLLSLEEGLKTQRKKKEELQESWHKLEMEKLEVFTNRDNLQKKIWEEQEKDLEKIEVLREEEKKEIESYPQKISELKEKLKLLGAVNLLASEEYQQQKERFDFLQKQMQDLVEAKGNLVSTIDKINQTATELFLETFQKVKTNFQQVFEQLFEGGETELNLIEGMDPLESPIEISARPLGKKLININQLSGGEKALTALSLLFALYLVKPSPFCILDEVDAPLDDANLDRFIKLIKNFSQKTQFIIITHNKMTMESADVLYGVTMEKLGVSKIVSVKLNPEEVIAEKV